MFSLNPSHQFAKLSLALQCFSSKYVPGRHRSISESPWAQATHARSSEDLGDVGWGPEGRTQRKLNADLLQKPCGPKLLLRVGSAFASLGLATWQEKPQTQRSELSAHFQKVLKIQ